MSMFEHEQGGIQGWSSRGGFNQPASPSSPTPAPAPVTAITNDPNPRPTNKGGKHYADKMNAWLYREQWSDYQNRFAPVEQSLVDDVMGSELLEERLSAIKANSGTAFDIADNNAGMVRERYGIQQSGQQQAVQQRSNDMQQALSTADALNNTRTHDFDRKMAALGGSGMRQALQGV